MPSENLSEGIFLVMILLVDQLLDLCYNTYERCSSNILLVRLACG